MKVFVTGATGPIRVIGDEAPCCRFDLRKIKDRFGMAFGRDNRLDERLAYWIRIVNT